MSGRETRGQPGEGASEAAADPPSKTPSSERTPATGAFEFALATAPLPNASELAPGVVSSVLKQGDRIGEQERFEITGQLGRGGIGRVFSALDRQLDRSVAVKFISPDPRIPWEDLVALLQREGKTLAQLRHENIVAIFDIGTWNKVPYLVMEHLKGESLARVLERERLEPRRTVELMIDVARGLAHAHKQGIVHRDLKPSNVLVVEDGRAKILDFGLAVFSSASPGAPGGDGPPGPLSPASGGRSSVAGTPAYMAPEQWRGETQDERTDIWAAGVMLFRMFTGEPPYPLADVQKLCLAVASDDPAPSVLSRSEDLADEAARIVARAMHKSPAGRFQTAVQFLDALVDLGESLARSAVASRQPLRRSQRRQLTFLSCGLSGLTSLSEDPEELSESLSVFNRTATEAISSLDGRSVASVGGKLLACFGHPVAREGDAHRAVRAGLKIVDAVRRALPAGGPRPGVRIGIHTGVVIVEDSEAEPGTLHIQGVVPDLAAALEGRAAADAVVIGHPTYQLVRGFFDVERVAAEGNLASQPLAAYRVLRESNVTSRFDPTFASTLTPLVGREAELARILELWSAARESRGQMLSLSGEAGIGKSRLVATLKGLAGEETTRVTCQCWPQFKGSSFYPVIDLLQRTTEILREDSPQSKLRKLEASVSALGMDLAQTLPLLASLLSIEVAEPYAPLRLEPRQRKRRIIDTLVTVLLRMAARRPVLFVVEDLHWADASTLELLGALLEQLAAHRILVLLTARPEFEPPWPRRPQLNAVAIDRLPPAQAASLVERAAGLSTLNAEVIQRLAAQTDGIPLFVEEMTRMVVESLGEPKDGARADGALLPEAIPATLNELLLARLDRLTAAGKEVVQLGAVLGRSFGYSLIQRVWTLEEGLLRKALASVAEAGVLLSRDEPPHSNYQFKHSLIQEAAYHSLPKKRRREHHLRVAQVLAEAFPELAETQPELLAHHYGEAGLDREALVYGERAGQRAVERSAAVEAIGHFGGALKRLANLPEDAERDQKELSLQLALGAPLMAAKGYGAPEVEKAYARARALCRVVSGDAQLFPAVQGLWQYYLVRGQLPTARELAEQLLGLARASGDPALQLMAQRSLATTVFLLGEIETCRQLTEAGLALYDPEQHRTLAFRYGQDPGVAHGLYLAWSLWLLGYPDQSSKTVLAALDLALQTSHGMSIAFARCFVGLLQNCRGEHAAAAAQAEAASAIAGAHQLTLWIASATMMDGWARSGLGEHEQGIARLQRGVAGWRETGGRAGLTFFLVTLAEAHCKAGQLAEAESVLAQVEAVRVANGEHYYAEELHRIRGEIALRRDPEDQTRAEAEFREAVLVARRQNAKSLELRAATSLGELLDRQGKRDEARELLQQIYGWFSEGFSTADLVKARALLDRLG